MRRGRLCFRMAVWAAVVVQLQLLFVLPLHSHWGVFQLLKLVSAQSSPSQVHATRDAAPSDPFCPACALANRGSLAAAAVVKALQPIRAGYSGDVAVLLRCPDRLLRHSSTRGPPALFV